MLSRVAESVYWMGRYIERAENVARFIDVNLHVILDFPLAVEEQWEPLVRATGDHELFKELYGKDKPSELNEKAKVLRFLAFDNNYPSSIISCLRQARENARTVRDSISSEMWEQLNKFYLMMMSPSAIYRAQETPHDFFTEVRMAVHLFQGLTEATMSHGEEWHFFNLGRMLERADKTARILDVKYFILLPNASDVGTVVDDLLWTALLQSVSGFEMFRRRHGRITPDKVVDFLLLDREFPRAVLYCLTKAEESLLAISGTQMGTFKNFAEQKLSRLRSDLAYCQVSDIISRGLHEYIESLETDFNFIGEGIFDTFFALQIQSHSFHEQ